MKTILLILMFAFGWLCNTSVFAAPVSINASLAPMLEKVLPAVVNIRAQIKITDFDTLSKLQQQRKNNRGTPGLPSNLALSVGSGVIVDAEKGYILTNAHVIDDAQTITVILGDSRHFSAKVIGMDKPSDIALLQIKAKKLTAITMSNSTTLKVGDFVAAVGNPFGLTQTVTSGIVSGLGRATLGIEGYENFIQTDAPINPGNSGGALINIEGQLVGINTAIIAPDRGSIGIGFAIPSNMAKSVMLQLIEFGNVQRGALGIGVQDITPELATAFNVNITKGAVVTQILPNSPAHKIGLQVNDVITKINDADIQNANDVVNAIAFLRVNSKAAITLLRNNKPLTLTGQITDAKKRQEISQQIDPLLYGVSLKNFTILSPMYGDVKGILVVSIEEDTNAWHADLRPGDVIISANQKPVTRIPELQKIAADTKSSLLLNVLRGNVAIFLVINKEQ